MLNKASCVALRVAGVRQNSTIGTVKPARGWVRRACLLFHLQLCMAPEACRPMQAAWA